MLLFFHAILLLTCLSQSNQYSFDYENGVETQPQDLETIMENFDDLEYKDTDNFETIEKDFDDLDEKDITLDQLASIQKRINKLLLAKKDKDQEVLDYFRNLGIKTGKKSPEDVKKPFIKASTKDFKRQLLVSANPTKKATVTFITPKMSKDVKATASNTVEVTKRPTKSIPSTNLKSSVYRTTKQPTKSPRSTNFRSSYYRTTRDPCEYPRTTYRPWSSGRPWTDKSWTDKSWTNSWTDKSWTDMSTYRPWTDKSWTDKSWTDNSWTDKSWTDRGTYRPWTNTGSGGPWTDYGSTRRPFTDWRYSSYGPWTHNPCPTNGPQPNVKYIGGCHYWGGINQCNIWNFERVKVDKGCKNDKWFYNCEYTVIQNEDMCEYDFYSRGCRESCNKCGLDTYITAVEKFEKCGDTMEPEFNMMYSFIPKEVLEEDTNCHCYGDYCPSMKFCAKLKYRRRRDVSKSIFKDHSKLYVCVENGRNIMDPHFSPDEICLSDTTREVYDYDVANEWREFTFEFEAKCQILEIVVATVKESDHIDIDHTALYAGGCPQGPYYEDDPIKKNGFKRLKILPALDKDMSKRLRDVMKEKSRK